MSPSKIDDKQEGKNKQQIDAQILEKKPKSFLEQLELLRLRYELTTAISMLEPMEKLAVNVVILLMLTLIGYTVMAYIPYLAKSIVSWPSSLLY